MQDIDTGVEGVNNFQKLSKTMIRDNRRDSFITNILETALGEKIVPINSLSFNKKMQYETDTITLFN